MQKQILVFLTIISSLFFLGAINKVQAQNEQKGFSFQGYARDFGGAAYSSSAITAQFSIYPFGEAVEYTEVQNLTTDAFGVFHATIGTVIPANFAAIDFSAKKYFMKVEVKVTGGEYVIITDTELLAVPYAKAAEKSINANNALTANTALKADNGNPPGVILSFAGPTGNIPTGYLACDGSSVAVADYPELYAAIGDAWGGDGGSNFNVPDLRGQFMRGFDNAAGVDPDAASRTAKNNGGNTGDLVGSYQTDALQQHGHAFGFGDGGGSLGPAPRQDDDIGFSHQGNFVTHVIHANVAAETRPKNAYVLFMIKY